MTDHGFALRLPPFTVTFSEEGEPFQTTSEGDILLVRHGTMMGAAISKGQKIMALTEPELNGFTWCDHVAVTRMGSDGAMEVSEMGFRGYERRPVSDYQAELGAVVHFDVSDELRANAVGNDEAMRGIKYGWLEYLPQIIDGLSGARFHGGWGDHVICSTHATFVAMGLGLFPDTPPSGVIPARWAMWVGASHADV